MPWRMLSWPARDRLACLPRDSEDPLGPARGRGLAPVDSGNSGRHVRAKGWPCVHRTGHIRRTMGMPPVAPASLSPP
jgi:hypothetical protein